MPFVLVLLVGASWRVFAAYHPAFANFAPVTALAFCGAVYFSDWRGWGAAAVTLTVSDIWLNHYYASTMGYTWNGSQMLLRLGVLGAASIFGRLVARRYSLIALIGGATASSLAFYLITNTAAWASDPFYPRTSAGWWQAMTIGHPEWPPTVLFLRNALIGDLTFTTVCSLVAVRAAKVNLAAA